VRPLLLAAALLVALPDTAQAQGRAPDLERDPGGFFVEVLRYRLDIFDVAPYDAATLLGRDWQPLTLGLNFDLQRRRARLRFGLGDHSVLAIGFRADVALEGAASRIRSRVDLAFGGHGLSLRLPDVIVVPRFIGGRMVMEFRVPIIERRF